MELKMNDPQFSAVPTYADIFTDLEWREAVADGSFIPDDGDGYWMMGETQESNVDCFDPQPTWATHVAWYNK